MTSEGCEQPGEDEAAYWRSQAEYWRTEAESRAAAEAELKTQNTVLRARVGELDAQVTALAEGVATLARLAFGKSSEKSSKKEDSGKAAPPDPEGGGRTARTGGTGQRAVNGASSAARLGTAAATTPICPPARRSTTSPPVSGVARVAGRAMPRSGRRAASRSTGRCS